MPSPHRLRPYCTGLAWGGDLLQNWIPDPWTAFISHGGDRWQSNPSALEEGVMSGTGDSLVAHAAKSQPA